MLFLLGLIGDVAQSYSALPCIKCERLDGTRVSPHVWPLGEAMLRRVAPFLSCSLNTGMMRRVVLLSLLFPSLMSVMSVYGPRDVPVRH